MHEKSKIKTVNIRNLRQIADRTSIGTPHRLCIIFDSSNGAEWNSFISKNGLYNISLEDAVISAREMLKRIL
jgi:hypothetical protein